MRMLIISFHPYTGVSKKRQYFPYSFCVSNFSISLVALCMYICRHIDMDIDIDVDIAIDIDIDVDTHLAIVKPEGTVQHAMLAGPTTRRKTRRGTLLARQLRPRGPRSRAFGSGGRVLRVGEGQMTHMLSGDMCNCICKCICVYTCVYICR